MKTEKFEITGMTCAACQANITRSVKKLEGVEDVNVSLLANQMSVTYDGEKVSQERIVRAVTGIGYGAEAVKAPGPSGQASPQEQGGKPGQNPGSGQGFGENDFQIEWKARKSRADEAQKAMKRRLLSSVALLIPLMYVAMGAMLSLPVPGFLTGMDNALISALTQAIITVPILFINRHFFQSGFKALLRRVPNMDSLVAVGSSASLVYGIFAMYRMAYGFGHGDMDLVHRYSHELYFESAAMILTLVTVGKYLEARSKLKTSDALGKLVDLAPKTAVVVRDGLEQTIPANQVAAGDIVVIRPGESIPVDGVITEGNGYVDQAAITGESIPVEKQIGDTVISASINKNGTFRFQASRVGNDTTLAQIIRLVDEAGNSKAPIARLADRVSGVFVPIVMAVSLLTAIVWLIAGQPFEFALSCAIAVLVISCPCALGLATPVAIMVGTGKAAEYGILIKSAESLETLHTIDTIVLDKTGTITSGHPSVTDLAVLAPGLSEDDFLAEAAAVEAGSEHPLAQAIVEKAEERGLSLPAAARFRSVTGRGVTASLDGQICLAGNLAFIQESIDLERDSAARQARVLMERLAGEGKTPLLFTKGGRITGIAAVADTLRDTSRAAIRTFREMGLNVIMLTGDNRLTAEAIRKELGLKEVISDVLPTEKECCIRELQEKGHRVAMVGDGINDAPALTRADIGIAIGAGTDIAIDSADIVLMKNSLNDVATAIELSRSVVRNIHMNLFWAFFYNILGIPVAAGALYTAFHLRLSPMIGSAAMSLSSVCVVANALRLRFFKEKKSAVPPSPVSAFPADEDKESINNGDAPLPDQKGQNTMKKVMKVEGMMCAHCQSHVQKALASVEGVSAVTVDLEKKQAEITLEKDVADQALMDAVTEAGYTPADCKTV